MKTFAIALLAGTAALFAGSARAADIQVSGEYAYPDVHQVRLVCDEDGRCYRTRGGRRVIERESYNYYAPRERYRERRVYRDRDWDDDGPGVGIRTPGGTVGIGVDRY